MKNKISNNDFSIKAVIFLFKLLLLVVSVILVVATLILGMYYAGKLVVYVTGNEEYHEIFKALCIAAFIVGGIISILYAAVDAYDKEKGENK